MLAFDDELPEYVYERDNGSLVPSDVARSPWFPEAQHGAPVAALITRVLADCEGGEDYGLVRTTIDMLRPVPFGPLQWESRLIRSGKRVQFVEATLRSGDTEVVHATGVRLRESPLDLVDADGKPLPETDPPDQQPPPPDTVLPHEWSEETTNSCWWMAYGCALDRHVVRGSWEEPGAITIWFRLLLPFIAGTENRPSDRLMSAADWTGIGSLLPFSRFMFPNVDMTVHVHRPPRGEWVCLDAKSWIRTEGNALGHSALFDTDGRVGTAMQTAVISAR